MKTRKIRLINFFLLAIFVLIPTITGLGQEQIDGPVYIVQEGDSLWSIAIKFGVSLEDLQELNNLSNTDQLAIGDRLVIPGLEGVEGIIVTRQVPLGESLRSLSRQYQIPEAGISKMNRFTSPSELFAGSYLVIPEQEETLISLERALVPAGISLLEMAAGNNSNPWDMVIWNDLDGASSGLSGDILFFEKYDGPGETAPGPGGLPEEVASIYLAPRSPLQGKAATINISAPPGLSFGGSFLDNKLNIFPNNEDGYSAIHGVHAMTEPGLYPLQIEGERSDGSAFGFSQMVLVGAVNYPFDRPLTVDPATIDPVVTMPEDAEWNQLASTATLERLWEGIFQLPSPLPVDYCLQTGDCWSSRYGNRRSYNGGPYSSFHTGLDIVGKTGTEIYAPAPGVVVFAGPLTVRGNATMINHGWGVYTAYMHQEEILVQVGEVVESGQVIGLVGATGRVEGPHLHWEIWAGGVQIDPMDWLEQAYP